jgi:hypothetical protein
LEKLQYYTQEAARCWWFTPVILATQEAEIRRIMVQSQPGQTVHKTLSQKKSFTKGKKKAGGVAQGVGGIPTPSTAKTKTAQVVEHLPSKHEAVSLSNPRTTKKKKVYIRV